MADPDPDSININIKSDIGTRENIYCILPRQYSDVCRTAGAASVEVISRRVGLAGGLGEAGGGGAGVRGHLRNW